MSDTRTTTQRIVRGCGFAAVSVGFLVLVGWFADIPVLKQALPGFSTMKANTALSLFGLGVSLLGLAEAFGSWSRRAIAGAAVAAAIGMLTLFEYAAGFDIGIDELLARDPGSQARFAGRPALATALLLVALGAAACILFRARKSRLAQALIIFALSLSGLSSLGYLYDASEFLAWGTFGSVAIHTAFLMLVVSIGLLAAAPDVGLVRLLGSGGQSGVLTRRLIPTLAFTPVLIGWLSLHGQKLGWYESQLALAILVMGFIVAFSTLLYSAARRLMWNEDELQCMNARLEHLLTSRTEELRISEQLFRAIFHSQFQFIGVMSTDGVVLEANRTALAAVGVSVEVVVGKPFWETPWWTHDPAQQARLRTAVARAAAGDQDRFEAVHLAADGTAIRVDFSLTPFRDKSGRVAFLIPEGRDITELLRTREELRIEEERFRSAFDFAPIGMAIVATNGRWLRVNRMLCELVGYTEDELLHIDFQTITHPDDLERDRENVRQLLAGAIAACQEEKRYIHKSGRVVPVLLAVSLVREANGSPRYFVAQLRDVTERKLVDARVLASLREKELLLKEIHHRVKNNLQIVSTLLDLQSDHTQDRQTLAMFQDSRGRVRSMALIHERLYRSEDLARIDFADYVRQLAEDLYRTYRVSKDDIELMVSVGVPAFPIDVAIPCGLLLNELISNCLKHAFRREKTGAIRVELHREGDTNTLTVADNGAGMPPEFEMRTTASFGMQLVQTLAEQLRGTVELRRTRGTEITVMFPAKA